ncbi:hypothetical protein [Candidatus Liberibacter asiaticus]|uniref:Phage protein n=2 Tax=Liberibacter asiaticus TaxID=34021 RepID=C6XH26_LIBAP|nr:hypothetical protein [Candidatus Liberibacter asiaticus]YP_007011065.1 tail protein [Liberibacter phage SC1]ACT57681.1 hypothetical protein CLIBASIA_05575 [Candidatus Liberibacter asiaticus str. psy62]ADV02496.1 hypothetical protein SC1_gp080 [Liberibacter phage SC1]ADV02638.1 hypothetical protein SC1_gp080 [Candidatus Liberibacter asiaticus]KAE9509615.1 hypothetical protein FXW22_05360 [Candidatus Liberibacter asiaticus]KAE9511753.1 hypothetical protein FXW32_05325 [Candidatus Liberibacte
MVNTTWTKHSFSAGELSPRLLQSRKDLSLHAQGVAKSRNLIPLRYGPLVSMPLMQEYRDCRLDPRSNRVFSFSIPDGGYALLVFGDKKLQIVVVRSSTKWSPALFGKTYKTPYTFKDNKSLEYAVFGSTAVFVHKDHPPHHLLYIQDGDKISFTFDEIKFLPPPWLGDGMISGVKSNAKLSISQADTSTARITSDMKIFKPLDKGRSIRLGCHPPEWAKNTNYSIGAYIVADDKVYRSLTTGRSGDRFGYSKGATYVKDNNITWITVLNLSSKTSRESASGAVAPYYVWGDIKDVSKDGRSISVAPQSQTLFQAGVSVVSWFMSAWGEQEGYPSHVTFHNNRLLFSGSKGDELSVYLSSFGAFYDFSLDGEYGCYDPTKALTTAVTDFSASTIHWMHPFGEGVLVGCDTSLWLLSISLSKGLSIDFRRVSGSGVYACPPVSVGDCLVFVCGVGRRIKYISGSTEQGFRFNEITQLADHLFNQRILQLVYQEEPHSIVWVVLEPKDNSFPRLLGCRFSAEGEGDFAWHTHMISDKHYVLSAASFPNDNRGGTSLWMLVALSAGEERSFTVRLNLLDDFK